MNEKKIVVNKTARYFVLGETSSDLKSIWFVCHGYGELAKNFIKKFSPINNGKNIIVAPEAFNRFYLNGLSGKVGASWMSREDPHNDVMDNNNFLDDLYSDIMEEYSGQSLKINVLGFSQGSFTATRWLANNKSMAHNLILWSGLYPPDIEYSSLKSMKNWVVMGDEDEYIQIEKVHKQESILFQNKVCHETVIFHGNHDICPFALKDLEKRLNVASF